MAFQALQANGRKMKKKKTPARIIIISLAVLLIIIVAILAFIPPIIIGGMVNDRVSFNQEWEAQEFGLESDKLLLTTEDGLNIVAYEVFHHNPSAVIVFLSGIHEPSVTAFYGHAAMLYEYGCSSILLEMRAHGESEGEVIALGYHEHLDTQAVVNYISSKPQYEDVPIIVYGLSMGGATAINSIGRIPEIDGLISLSAYSSWADVFHDNMVNMGFPRILASMQRTFVNLYTGFKYGWEYSHLTPKNSIQKLGDRPALLVHSTDDSQVPYRSFERLVEKAPDHVETWERPGDLHLIVDPGYFLKPSEDTAYASRIIDFLDAHFELKGKE